jgi:hypothetical protein
VGAWKYWATISRASATQSEERLVAERPASENGVLKDSLTAAITSGGFGQLVAALLR